MANLFVIPDVEALVRARILGLYGDEYLDFLATKFPDWVSPDRVPERGIYFWLAGGYTTTRSRGSLNQAQILVHSCSGDETTAIQLASDTAAFLCTSDGARFGTGRILTGPYSNPLPDHKKYLYRYSVQLELPVYAQIRTL